MIDARTTVEEGNLLERWVFSDPQMTFRNSSPLIDRRFVLNTLQFDCITSFWLWNSPHGFGSKKTQARPSKDEAIQFPAKFDSQSAHLWRRLRKFGLYY